MLYCEELDNSSSVFACKFQMSDSNETYKADIDGATWQFFYFIINNTILFIPFLVYF